MTRVAVVAPYGADPVNGVLVAAVASAAAAAGQGAAVELWLPHPWPEVDFSEHVSRLDAAGVPQVVLDTRDPPRKWLRPAALRAARQRDVDVVHLHSAFSPHIAQLAWALRRPYVVTPHGAYSPAALRRSRARKLVALATVERAVLRRAQAFVALTDAEAADVGRWTGRTPVVVVPNGVEPPASVDREALRRELRVAPDVPLAVFAGRLDREHKGLDHLVAGLAAAPQWVLALVGPDDRGDRALLEAQARRLGAAERCRFLGLRQGRALHEALAGADVFALCSRWEGLPLALLEALAYGVPAVVSPAVERAVPVAASGAGWVCDPADVGATLRGVAAAGEAERRRRGKAAMHLAGEYRWEQVGRRLAGLYVRLADG